VTSDAHDSLTEDDLRGFKYFRTLLPLFARLHETACQRDAAGNRILHFDQYCCLILLQLFSPAVATLRLIQKASAMEKVQRILGCSRTSLGSLSESSRVFDSQLLLGIIGELAEELKPLGRDARLSDIKHVITLVDGSLLQALPRVAEAMWLTTRTGTTHAAWRLHTHFDLDKYVPVRAEVTDPSNSGNANEKEVLRRTLRPDHCYLMDRGYAQFALFNDINAKASSYVCRVRDNSEYQVVRDNPLSAADREAGIISDQIVMLGQRQTGRTLPDHPVRLVIVKTKPHDKRSNRKGNTGAGPSDGQLRIATNLLDPPAHIISLLYQKRYEIELFFRFLKSMLGCRHLISENRNGIEIQVYCAIIACMILNLYTARRPDKLTLAMAYWYMTGLASEQEFVDHLNQPDNRGVKLRAKDELWKKLGVN
jgi:Transposase DDE domain